MEASYFYYRPSDLTWIDGIKGHELDKGFNIKLTHRVNNSTSFAVGLDDFAGTGYFSKEYFVAKKSFSNLSLTTGIGWGKFNGISGFKNPISYLNDGFESRPLRDSSDLGGTPQSSSWFRGDAALFGGFEYNITKFHGLKLKLEYDPFDYMDLSALNRKDANLDLRRKDSNINYGLSYQVNKFLTIDTSYMKGNTFNFTISYALPLNDNFYKKPKFQPKIEANDDSKISFYDDLLKNLNNNKLLLQTADLDGKKLSVSISTSDHRNAIRSSSYAAYISKKVADSNNIDLTSINISHLNLGIELNNITYIANHLNDEDVSPLEVKINYTDLEQGKANGYKKDEFQPYVDFPVIFQSTAPAIASHIGNPEKFYFGGLNLQNISEIQFSRNLILSSELNYSLYQNFRDTIAGPASEMEHVRTDVVQYLKEDDFFITRMQLDYIWSPHNNIYAKFSGGIFEQMYGGLGGQLLYKPFNSNFSLGAELFYVKQRTFNQKFDFQDYSTTTGHINLGYKFASGIESNLSFGRYLAKDDGFTFDLSRTTNSGFKAGIYFTRTNVSAEVFGEGSFDKGFYFQIPLDIFSKEYRGNYSSIKVSPLTRDGGAKLIYDKDLKGLIYNSTYSDLMNQWNGFLN